MSGKEIHVEGNVVIIPRDIDPDKPFKFKVGDKHYMAVQEDDNILTIYRVTFEQVRYGEE